MSRMTLEHKLTLLEEIAESREEKAGDRINAIKLHCQVTGELKPQVDCHLRIDEDDPLQRLPLDRLLRLRARFVELTNATTLESNGA